MQRKNFITFITFLCLFTVCSCAWSTTVIQIAASLDHTSALKSDGTVWCWGSNAYGQLGDGTTTDKSYPIQVPGLTGVAQIALGYDFTLALKSDGTLWAWGYNAYGQLGNGTTINSSIPVQVPELTGIKQVSAGYGHTVVLKNDGTVLCWGYNHDGQVGDGTRLINRLSPVQALGLTGITQVAASRYHTLALKNDNTVWGWGDGSYSRFGDGVYSDVTSPKQVSNFAGAIQLAPSEYYSAILKNNGTVWSCGNNTSGQLGDGTSCSGDICFSIYLTQALGLTGITQISARYCHTVVIKNDGTLWIWGLNQCGQLGIGNTTNSNVPVQVPGMIGTAKAAAGYDHTIAMKNDGTVWAWGDNYFGQIGDGSKSYRPSPIQLLTETIQVSSGGGCMVAVKKDGSIWTWGRNPYGQLGDGTTSDRHTPARLTSIFGITKAVTNGNYTVALKSDGTLWAFGANDKGQLGDGTTIDRVIPTQVSGLTGVRQVAIGYNHTVAVKNDGTVWTWGYNRSGQLGDGTITDKAVPIQVSGLTDVIQVSAGYSNTFALKSDGTVWAWGSGALGDGTGTSSKYPVQVAGLTGVAKIAANGDDSIALKSDGTVWTWGSNNFGQLGNGTTTYSLSPVQVSSLTGNAKDISAAYDNMIIAMNDGTVWGWGYNKYGQLGDGTTVINRTTPVQAVGLADVAQVSAGYNCTAVLKDDGSVWTWGYKSWGQLGDGTIPEKNSPVMVIGLNPITLPGSISINEGATHTASAFVTLRLSSSESVDKMCISNDGVFDIESWEDYATEKTWNLDIGDGIKTVYVKFKDPTGNESNVVSASIILDQNGPVIGPVTVAPAMAAAGDVIKVSVNTSDTYGVANVSANGVPLSNTSGNIWEGSFTAASLIGSHTVSIRATDVSDNSTDDTSATYRTSEVVGLTGKWFSSSMTDLVTSQWLFTVWGKVSNVTTNTFDLNNGCGDVIRVTALGYTGISNGDFASARGILNILTTPKSLESSSDLVKKRN